MGTFIVARAILHISYNLDACDNKWSKLVTINYQFLMERNSQRQHFIPEAYLREFTSDRKGFFYQLNISSQRLEIRKVHVENVCYLRNFYDIDNKQELNALSLNDPRYLETSFTYENVLTKILEKIRDKEKYLSKKEFEIIVESYVSIKHRGPRFRKEIEKLKQEGVIFDRAARDLKPELTALIQHYNFDFDNFVVGFKQQIQNDPSYAQLTHLRGLVESSRQSNEPYFDAVTKILSMNISILEIENEYDYFFISDNPGYSLLGNKMFNTNYGTFDTIHWPINSKQLVLLNGFDPLNYINPLIRINYIPVRSHFVQEVNKMTFLIANEKIFCENKDFLNQFKPTCNTIRSEMQKLIAVYSNREF